MAVLAGDRYPEAWAVEGVRKALLPVAGAPSLAHVLRAADRARAPRDVVVVGPPALDGAIAGAGVATPTRRVEQGDSLSENLVRAFAAAEIAAGERLILVTADIPLVTPAELDRFVGAAARSPADALIALARTPPSRLPAPLARAYRDAMIVARGGPYLLGNLFAVRRTVLEWTGLMERGRGVRRQSSARNMARALAVLLAIGLRAGPALATWLRLVGARWVWRRRRDADRVPRVAPSPAAMGHALSALVARRLSVEFVEIGPEGACFDIDRAEQLEAVRAVAGGG